MKNHVNGL